MSTIYTAKACKHTTNIQLTGRQTLEHSSATSYNRNISQRYILLPSKNLFHRLSNMCFGRIDVYRLHSAYDIDVIIKLVSCRVVAINDNNDLNALPTVGLMSTDYRRDYRRKKTFANITFLKIQSTCKQIRKRK